MATSDGKRLFQHFRLSSERRLPQTLCQSPYAIQSNLLQLAANAATSLPACPLW